MNDPRKVLDVPAVYAGSLSLLSVANTHVRLTFFEGVGATREEVAASNKAQAAVLIPVETAIGLRNMLMVMFPPEQPEPPKAN